MEIKLFRENHSSLKIQSVLLRLGLLSLSLFFCYMNVFVPWYSIYSHSNGDLNLGLKYHELTVRACKLTINKSTLPPKRFK